MEKFLTGVVLIIASIVTVYPAGGHAKTDKTAILETYADIAHAGYEDSLMRAKELQTAVNALIANPSGTTLQAAKQAWLASRVPYMQTEAFRFGNALVDDWEGKVNAWPLDEGLIDYVASNYGAASANNPAYAANVIANTSIKLGNETIDASAITKPLLAEKLQELGGVEANVATGYHAIEFLLWGQDLNGNGPGSGNRPWTDYDLGHCTHGHCQRRAEYLETATDLLVDDLDWMTRQWAPGGQGRKTLVEGSPDAGITAIVTGMGSLSYGELAGERMKLGLMLHDPEEEHDCFSDNTHNSHYYDVVGMRNVYTGTYTRIDGRRLSGPSLSQLVSEANPEMDTEMLARLEATEAAVRSLVERARAGEAYDQMIGPNNPEGNAVVQSAIDTLTSQTKTIEKIVSSLGLTPIAFEGSDSLDNPEAVFK